MSRHGRPQRPQNTVRTSVSQTLEGRLERQVPMKQLVHQGILHDPRHDVSFNDAKHLLEVQMARDKIAHNIVERPSIHDLQLKGYMPDSPSHKVAPSISPMHKRMDFMFAKQKVGHELDHRHSMPELRHAGVVPESHVAPALQGAAMSLEKNLAKSNLHHLLKRRPSMQDVVDRGILKSDEVPYQTLQTTEVDESVQQPTLFGLMRLLLKVVWRMSQRNEINSAQKIYLKQMIITRDELILAAAQQYIESQDYADFKSTIMQLVGTRQK
ncbi:MAG: hypothetical protein MHM6MM_003277 [Cercozoa sp. M6MM]